LGGQIDGGQSRQKKFDMMAFANKVARIVSALMMRGGEYNELPAASYGPAIKRASP
jgi:hypothetical protein